MDGLITIIILLLQLMWFALFARAIVSWFPIDANGPIVRALDAITEPILQPLRRVVPKIGTIDITPMVAIVLIIGISRALESSISTT